VYVCLLGIADIFLVLHSSFIELNARSLQPARAVCGLGKYCLKFALYMHFFLLFCKDFSSD